MDKEDKFFALGYFNLHLDNDMLTQFMYRNAIRLNPYTGYFWPGALDVSVLALEYLKRKRANLKDFKLCTVAAYLGIKVSNEGLHDAVYDAKLTWEIYKKITYVK